MVKPRGEDDAGGGGERASKRALAVVQALAHGFGANSTRTLDISSSRLRAEGTRQVALALRGNASITALCIARNDMSADRHGCRGKDLSGVTDLAHTLPTMRALTSLDISANHLAPCDHSKDDLEVDLTAIQAVAAAIGKCTYVPPPDVVDVVLVIHPRSLLTPPPGR